MCQYYIKIAMVHWYSWYKVKNLPTDYKLSRNDLKMFFI